MKKLGMRRVLWNVIGMTGLVFAALAFAVLGPHASAERAEAGAAAEEWRAWRDAEDAAGFAAWDALGAVAERLKQHEHERYGDELLAMSDALERLLTGAWDDPRHASDLARLGDMGELVEEILAAAEKPFGSWRRVGVARDAQLTFDEAIPMEAWGPRRRMARLLCVSMRECAARGDWEGVERRARGSLRIARHSFVGESAMAMLVAAGQWMAGAEEAARVAAEHGATRDVCERLARVIEEGRLPVEVLARASKGERLFQLGTVREHYNRHGYMMMWVEDAVEWGPLTSSWDDDKPSAWDRVAGVRAYFEARLPTVERRIRESMDLQDGWIAVVAADEADWRTIRREGRKAWEKDSELEHEWGTTPTFVRSWLSLQRAARGAATTLRIAGWKAEHGRWPSGLEEALSGAERENPWTGREFVYVHGEEAGGAFWLLDEASKGGEEIEWRGGAWRAAYQEREEGGESEEGGR